MFDDIELLALIEEAKKEIANGETISHEEVKKRLDFQDSENLDEEISSPTH